jgi:hypothetical protein
MKETETGGMHSTRSPFSSISDRKSQLLCASRLISEFNTRHASNDIYERALSCYDLLIDMLEDPGVARELSSSIHMPANKIQASADVIIDRLLFNQKNNPYLSFGFQGYVSAAEVTRRWKRLIVLYHPDRHPNQKKYEERAQKINQAYAEIQRIEKKGIHYDAVKHAQRPSFAMSNKIHYFRYMKRLPTIIVGAAILVAIVSMLLFISRIRKIHSVTYSNRETGISRNFVINNEFLKHYSM